MPRKPAEPAAEPLEQAASPPLIVESDAEQRLDEDLAAMAAVKTATAALDEAASDSQAEAPPEEPISRPRQPRQRKTLRRAAEEAPPAEDQVPAASAAEAEPPAKPARPRRRAAPSANSPPVITIDEQSSVETSDDKAQCDLIDLVESMRSGRYLTDTLQGVERNPAAPNVITAVIYHGDFKVLIPVEEAMMPPRDFHDRDPADVLHYQLSLRLGSEIDYIVKGIDRDNRIAAASRLEAMAIKRRQYYSGARSALQDGVTAEARVACVLRTGAFIEIFGVETYIPLRELSYQRWMDATQHYQPGQRVLVKLLSVDRKSAEDITVEASVKQAGENPYKKALQRYTVGNQYVGIVSVVDTTGVYVSLDGGIDCLCLFPKRGRPPRGSRVTVRIRGIDQKSNRIWGMITHMTTH